MLWDIIRNFFVQYVFGGTLYVDGSWEYFGGIVGNFAKTDDLLYFTETTSSFYLPFHAFNDTGEVFTDYICFGDWLSTTATIITLVALFVGISCLMVSLFRWIVRLVSLRG